MWALARPALVVFRENSRGMAGMNGFPLLQVAIGSPSNLNGLKIAFLLPVTKDFPEWSRRELIRNAKFRLPIML